MRIIALALSLTFGLIGHAQARPGVCGGYAEIKAGLAEEYQEVPRVVGVDSQGNMFLVVASKAGSWTLVRVNGQGIACLAIAGDGFTIVAPESPLAKEQKL